MNIFDYLRSKNIEPKKVAASGEHASSCPACGGNDRFRSWHDRFFCRGCNTKGGDIITLIMMVEGVDFKVARDISGKVTASRQNSRPLPPARPTLKLIELPSEKWSEVAAAFVERSHQELLKNAKALAWLKSERFITLETVKRFKIGVNPADLWEPREKWGLPVTANGPFKVGVLKGLTVPRFDCSGRLVQVKIRLSKPIIRPGQKKPQRFDSISGGAEIPAFFGQIATAFIVVESELDAILLWQEAGDIVTPISVGGTNKRPDSKTVDVMSSGKVSLISFDTDKSKDRESEEKEREERAKVYLTWKELLKNYQPWLIPSRYGKDHTEAVKAGLSLREWVLIGLEEAQENNHSESEPVAVGFQPSGKAGNTLEMVELAETEPGTATAAKEETKVAAATPDAFPTIVRAMKLAELSDEADVELINDMLSALEFFQEQADQEGLQFAVEALTLTITDIEKKARQKQPREISATDKQLKPVVPGMKHDLVESEAVISGQIVSPKTDQAIPAADQLLTIEAIRLLEIAGTEDRAEISRALNTFDTCRAGTDDYNFALSGLAAAVEDAAARLPKAANRAA